MILSDLHGVEAVVASPRQSADGSGAEHLDLRPMRLRGALCSACPLIPCLRRQPRLHFDHRDATIYRANARAEIAANTFCFVDPRNPREGSGIWSSFGQCSAF